jgi:hypothetical protein
MSNTKKLPTTTNKKKSNFKNLFNGLTFFLLGLILLLITLLIVQNFSNKGSKSSSNPQAISNFLNDLQNPTKNQWLNHQHLADYLTTINNKSKPLSSKYQQLIKGKQIPFDYQYFFKEGMPNYIANLNSASVKPLKHDAIITSIPINSSYQASVSFNYTNANTSTFEASIPKSTRQQRITVTGAYTSPYNMPVGLAIDKGKVVNPALQKWDGLIIINQHGQLFLNHIKQLNYQFKQYNINSSLNDYHGFLQLAKQEKLTVLQSHLLINNGQLLVDNKPNQKKFRRRIIFQTPDMGIHLYDSQKEVLSFYEAASYLKDNFDAIIAINLDMGTYNLGKRYSDGTLIEDLSHLGNNVVLSNLISIDY